MITTDLKIDLPVRIARWQRITVAVDCECNANEVSGARIAPWCPRHDGEMRIPDPKAAAIVEQVTEPCKGCQGAGEYLYYRTTLRCAICYSTGRVSRPFHEYGDGAFSGVIGRLAIEQLKVCSASERETWETIARTAIFFHDGFTLTTVDAALKEQT